MPVKTDDQVIVSASDLDGMRARLAQLEAASKATGKPRRVIKDGLDIRALGEPYTIDKVKVWNGDYHVSGYRHDLPEDSPLIDRLVIIPTTNERPRPGTPGFPKSLDARWRPISQIPVDANGEPIITDAIRHRLAAREERKIEQLEEHRKELMAQSREQNKEAAIMDILGKQSEALTKLADKIDAPPAIGQTAGPDQKPMADGAVAAKQKVTTSASK